MSDLPSVIAVDDGGTGSVPDRADYWLCQQVHERSGTEWLAVNARALIATPARILLMVVVAVLARYLAHRAIRRQADSTAVGLISAEGVVPGLRLKERFAAEGLRTPPPLLPAAGVPAGTR